MDAFGLAQEIAVKSINEQLTDWGAVINAIVKGDASDLKKMLKNYHDDPKGMLFNQNYIDLCKCKDISLELRAILMAWLLSLCPTHSEYLKVLNKGFIHHRTIPGLHSEIQEVLQQLGFNMRQKLNEATKETNYKNIKNALENFAKNEQEYFVRSTKKQPKDCPLEFAAFQGDIDTLQQLAKTHNIKERSRVFFWAIKGGCVQAVQYVLKNGTKSMKGDRMQATGEVKVTLDAFLNLTSRVEDALSKQDFKKLKELLIDAFAIARYRFPLSVEIRQRCVSLLEKDPERESFFNQIDSLGFSMRFYLAPQELQRELKGEFEQAVRDKNISAAISVIKKGLEITSLPMGREFILLGLAVRRLKNEDDFLDFCILMCAKSLFNHDLNQALDENKNTVLHLVRSSSLARELLIYGALPTQTNAEGNTPQKCAVIRGDIDVAETISAHCAMERKKILKMAVGRNPVKPDVLKTTLEQMNYRDISFLVDRCTDRKIPSELKIIFMARVLLVSRIEEQHLEILDGYFCHDIKKVLEQLDVQTYQKLNDATKNTGYTNIKNTLSKFSMQNLPVATVTGADEKIEKARAQRKQEATIFMGVSLGAHRAGIFSTTALNQLPPDGMRLIGRMIKASSTPKAI